MYCEYEGNSTMVILHLQMKQTHLSQHLVFRFYCTCYKVSIGLFSLTPYLNGSSAVKCDISHNIGKISRSHSLKSG